MEKRLSTKCNDYFKQFKYDIKNFIDTSDIDMTSENYQSLIQYIFDYDTITITKTDFTPKYC